MRYWPLFLAVPLLAASCDRRHAGATATVTDPSGKTMTATSNGDKTISGINIDTDGLKANVSIPGMSFGGDHMDVDGMKLYPGSKVRGVRVNATDRGGHEKGEVTMDFTSPAALGAVAAHMTAQAKKAGYAVSGVSPTGFTGSKRDNEDDSRMALTLTANGGTTSGQMTMSGTKAE